MSFKNKAIQIGAMVLAGVMAATGARADITSDFSVRKQGSTAVVDHSAWDALLKAYIVKTPGGLNALNYAAFKSGGHAKLKAYVKSLEKVAVSKLDRPEQYAYWANLYNAKTIDIVLDHYPVTSIRKITIQKGVLNFLKKSVGAGGPWKAKVVKVEGKALSLDDIEHGIMRPVFRDPRVHYAVNCASIGCPNLQAKAFTGADLEAMLDAGARAYINSPRGFKVVDGSIVASSIYSWFQVDFGGNERGVLRHAMKYAKEGLKAKLAAARSIDDYEYDWALNDVK